MKTACYYFIIICHDYSIQGTQMFCWWLQKHIKSPTSSEADVADGGAGKYPTGDRRYFVRQALPSPAEQRPPYQD